MGKIQRGDVVERFRSAVGQMRDEERDWTLVEQIVPVISVEAPSTGKETIFRDYNGTVEVIPGAGLFSVVGLVNPVASGVLGRIQFANLDIETRADVQIRTSAVTTGLTGTGLQGAMDFRTPGIGGCKVLGDGFAGGSVPGFVKYLFDIDSGAVGKNFDGITEALKSYVLTPGSSLFAASATADLNLRINIRWREQNITPSTA